MWILRAGERGRLAGAGDMFAGQDGIEDRGHVGAGLPGGGQGLPNLPKDLPAGLRQGLPNLPGLTGLSGKPTLPGLGGFPGPGKKK